MNHLSSAGIGVLTAHFFQFRDDQRTHTLWRSQQRFEVGDSAGYLFVFLFDFFPLQRSQAAQWHLEDGISLNFIQFVTIH